MSDPNITGELRDHNVQTLGQVMLLSKVLIVLVRATDKIDNLLTEGVKHIDSYNYPAAIPYLKSNKGISSEIVMSDPRGAVFLFLGQQYSTSSQTIADQHALHLLNLIGNSNDDRTEVQCEPSLEATSSLQSDEVSHLEVKKGEQLAIYTQALFKEGQKSNKWPYRSYETISLCPPLFSATIQFGDMTCVREGRTKKEASHLAAKNICKKLGLHVA